MEQKMQSQVREEMLAALKRSADMPAFLLALRAYIRFRLNLPQETKEDNLYRLVVYSVKLRMPDVDAQRLEERLATTDCHQTSYVVSRKNLLMMEIERALGVKLAPQALDRVETAADYAGVLWEAMQDAK